MGKLNQKNKNKKIIVFGSGEFGSLVSNIVYNFKGLTIEAFGDDNINNDKKLILNKPIFTMKELIAFAKSKNIKSAICSIGDNKVRADKYNYLERLGFEMISLEHPKSLIDSNVHYGKNVIIEMGTAIHAYSSIGNNVFLGGEALIGHHNKIGNHVLIGGNVSLGGSVTIDDYVSIGVGASIKPGVKIGKGAVVGLGSVVLNDVDPFSIVAGVPAKKIRKK